MEENNLEEELFDYNNTSFHNKCNEIVSEISNTFKNLGFTDMYFEYWKNHKYSLDEINQYIHDTLLNLDEFKRHDLNHMWTMLSEKNCWWIDYRIGDLVHKQLMRIWYPEDFK